MPIRLQRQFNVWRRFPPRDRMLAFESLATLAVVRGLLCVLPFRTIMRGMKPGPAPMPNLDDTRRETIARIVAATASYVPRATCLTRSITLFSMLRRRGYAIVLRIGVRKGDSGSLDAHAWVETCDGVCLAGNQERGATLMRFPSITDDVAAVVAAGH